MGFPRCITDSRWCLGAARGRSPVKEGPAVLAEACGRFWWVFFQWVFGGDKKKLWEVEIWRDFLVLILILSICIRLRRKSKSTKLCPMIEGSPIHGSSERPATLFHLGLPTFLHLHMQIYTDAINGILGHILYSPRMEHVHPTLNRYSSLGYVFFTSGARNSRMIGFAFGNKTQTIGQDGLYRDFYKKTFSDGYHDWSINPPLNVSPGFNFRPY